jgi:3-dehydroquinate dehydratase/shikimate dehydrogenase
LICASIRASGTDEAVRLLHRAKKEGAHLAELRADLIPGLDLERVLSAKPLPVIVTARPAWEGGRWAGDETERILLLHQAGRSGADYIDLEFKAYKDLPDLTARVIVSYHDFDRVPSNLEATVRKMEMLSPYAIKVACRPGSTREMLELAKLRTSTLRSVVAMGEWGEPLRILYGRQGSLMTYASIDEGSETAPGQIPLAELSRLYRADRVTEATGIYAVVGNPVSHSKGPRLWNRAFEELGIDGCYVRAPLDDAAQLRPLVSTLALSGLSVTVPYKQAVLPLLDEVDPVADRIGAVNTIVPKEGILKGYNTDWIGALRAIEEGCEKEFGSRSLAGRKVLVFGAGGTARAALYGMMSAGARAIVANRDWDRASDLAAEFGAEAVPLEAVEQIVDPEVVVNATSVGMSPNGDASIVPRSLLRPGQVCFDAVYTPEETRFLREAEEAGARTVSGARMFVLQAAEQFRHFTGRETPDWILSEWSRWIAER